MKKLLTLGLGAVMAMCAVSCSQDDELAVTEPQGFVSEKGEAYVNIKISAPSDAITRATTDGGYEYGTTEEQAIKSARFFFFNKDGKFIKEGLIYSDNGGVKGTDENVEYIDNKIVLLVNIGNESPAYVITVANPPADLDQKISGTNSIKDVESILESSYYTEGTSNGVTTKNFIMTTTSYVNNNAASETEKGYYYVTPINNVGVYSSYKEAEDASANVLNIYIERLAVKIGCTVNEDSNNGSSLTKGESTAANVYQLLDDDNKAVTIVGDSDNTPVYVHLIAWGINATTRQNYLFKHLDLSWNAVINGLEWNKPDYYRSFWGKSFNYGLADFNYPVNYHSNVNTDATATSAPWLTYIPSEQVDNSFGSVDYCMENTNTAEILKTSYNSAATAVLVKARIVNKEGNEFKEDIVKYGSTLYTYKGYAAYVVNALLNSGALNYFAGGTQISADDVDVVSASDKLNGRIYVQLTEKAQAKTWSDAATGGNAVEAATINNTLKLFNASSDALGYTRGLMYYSIPIKHLGAVDKEDGVEGDYATKLFETYLGVVRNHYYKLTINSLKGVGHGIVDPKEPIVPNPVEDTGYYLNAKINVLSWKVVSQTVDLGSK
jgi:hypothetical protein